MLARSHLTEGSLDPRGVSLVSCSFAVVCKLVPWWLLGLGVTYLRNFAFVFALIWFFLIALCSPDYPDL